MTPLLAPTLPSHHGRRLKKKKSTHLFAAQIPKMLATDLYMSVYVGGETKTDKVGEKESIEKSTSEQAENDFHSASLPAIFWPREGADNYKARLRVQESELLWPEMRGAAVSQRLFFTCPWLVYSVIPRCTVNSTTHQNDNVVNVRRSAPRWSHTARPPKPEMSHSR